jgi:hypothetical protein
MDFPPVPLCQLANSLPILAEEGEILVTSEVSSLEHEIRNHTMESAFRISLPPINISPIAGSGWRGVNTYPFCPVHNSRKFLAVLGTTSSYNLLHTHPISPAHKGDCVCYGIWSGVGRLQDDSAHGLLVCGDIKVDVCHVCCGRVEANVL